MELLAALGFVPMVVMATVREEKEKLWSNYTTDHSTKFQLLHGITIHVSLTKCKYTLMVPYVQFKKGIEKWDG